MHHALLNADPPSINGEGAADCSGQRYGDTIYGEDKKMLYKFSQEQLP